MKNNLIAKQIYSEPRNILYTYYGQKYVDLYDFIQTAPKEMAVILIDSY